MTLPLLPDRILGLGFGFFAAKALTTALDFDLFSLLAAKPLAASAIVAKLQLKAQRGAHDFLDALVALRLLAKDAGGNDPVYRLTPESARYLDKKSEFYLGGALAMAGKRLYGFWDHLGEALLSGEAQSEAKQGKKPLFDEIFTDPVKLRAFASAMSGLSRHNFEVFVDQFDFAPYKTHADIGCSTGLLCRLAAKRHPHLHCIAFDLPPVAAIAREHMLHSDVATRIEVVAGSFLTDPLPKADIITMGQILHDWSLADKKRIIQAAHAALPDGGAFVVIENLIDDARSDNAFGLLMSLNMLVEFGDAFDYTFAEFQSWCKEAGFRRFELMPVHGSCSAAIAYK